jgi:hypothetical protein
MVHAPKREEALRDEAGANQQARQSVEGVW